MVAVLGPNEALPYYIHTYISGIRVFISKILVLSIQCIAQLEHVPLSLSDGILRTQNSVKLNFFIRNGSRGAPELLGV
jgi:hypothetical protein